MIITLFLRFLENMVLYVLTIVRVDLPTTISTPLVTGVGYFNSLLLQLPFLQVLWWGMWNVIIPVEIGLLIFKFFAGQHTPVNNVQ